MLNEAQVRADFNKLRNENHPHGQIVILGFNGETCRALKSTQSKTITINDYGEDQGDMFTLRFLANDFTTTPSEKDVVTVDDVEYQVAEVRYSAYNQVVRAYILDSDA